MAGEQSAQQQAKDDGLDFYGMGHRFICSLRYALTIYWAASSPKTVCFRY
jgi:hypothetical protein